MYIVQFEECDYFKWYDGDERKAKKELKDERNCALVQAGEANAICELRQEEYEAMKKEILQYRSHNQSLRVDNNFFEGTN